MVEYRKRLTIPKE